MVAYRAYVIDEDDHFKTFRVLECPDDAAAIAAAKKLLDGADIEIWHLDRIVARLDHKQK